MAPKNGATKEAEAKKPTEKEALEKLKESGVVAEGSDFIGSFFLLKNFLVLLLFFYNNVIILHNVINAIMTSSIVKSLSSRVE